MLSRVTQYMPATEQEKQQEVEQNKKIKDFLDVSKGGYLTTLATSFLVFDHSYPQRFRYSWLPKIRQIICDAIDREELGGYCPPAYLVSMLKTIARDYYDYRGFKYKGGREHKSKILGFLRQNTQADLTDPLHYRALYYYLEQKANCQSGESCRVSIDRLGDFVKFNDAPILVQSFKSINQLENFLKQNLFSTIKNKSLQKALCQLFMRHVHPEGLSHLVSTFYADHSSAAIVSQELEVTDLSMKTDALFPGQANYQFDSLTDGFRIKTSFSFREKDCASAHVLLSLSATHELRLEMQPGQVSGFDANKFSIKCTHLDCHINHCTVGKTKEEKLVNARVQSYLKILEQEIKDKSALLCEHNYVTSIESYNLRRQLLHNQSSSDHDVNAEKNTEKLSGDDKKVTNSRSPKRKRGDAYDDQVSCYDPSTPMSQLDQNGNLSSCSSALHSEKKSVESGSASKRYKLTLERSTDAELERKDMTYL